MHMKTNMVLITLDQTQPFYIMMELFTELYYELFSDGSLELYIKYQNGLPIEDCFEFYENGKIKTYSYCSKDRLNRYSYSYDEKGKIKLSTCGRMENLLKKYIMKLKVALVTERSEKMNKNRVKMSLLVAFFNAQTCVEQISR